MDLVYLSRADIECLGIAMKEVLHAVHEGFVAKGRDSTEMPPKLGIHTRPDAFLHAMPAYIRDSKEIAGVKLVSGYPANAAKGLPYISGLLALVDSTTGIPTAVMDCTWITAMRTGASVGISAMYLARADSETAAMIGCGVQARTSLDALVETLPDLRMVRCYDVAEAALQAFIEDAAKAHPALEFETLASASSAARGADVVITAIPIVEEPDPDLDSGALEEGALAVSLDYDSAWTGAAMAECDRFFCDDTEQLLATRRKGPYFKGIPQEISADLGELATGLKPGRENETERLFSLNMGIAVADMAVADVVLGRALTQGRGVRLPL